MHTSKLAAAGLCLLLGACSAPTDHSAAARNSAADMDATAPASTVDSRFPGIRTLPDLTCPEDYAGTTGLIESPPAEADVGDYGVFTNGAEAPSDIAATLPPAVALKGRIETYTDDYYFAVRGGNVYFKPNVEVTGDDAAWREVLLPRCLQGQVSEISADGFVLLALNRQREIYTLDYSRRDYGVSPWTRRWGPFFWVDLGASIPNDVRDWAASELHSGVDEYFVDGGGYKQSPWGILTVYLLRGDGRRITYLDPWLPVDDSREVCGPERGTVQLAGLSGSGSTVMVVTADGEIYTRLYEFDVSGANTVFLDYSWHDQDDVENPLIQLPAPGWVHHPRVPGAITDRISLRKLSPGTEHRVMRIEGTDTSGNPGYWEKDQADLDGAAWRFVLTGDALRGRPLPLENVRRFEPEDFVYHGLIDGHTAHLTAFNPYCSPTTLRIEFGEGPLDLILHTTDGLRQERRARGLDLYPRYYRSAIEIPRSIYDNLDALPASQRDFLATHFGGERFIDGPLTATVQQVQVQANCWSFTREIDDLDAGLTQPPVPDLGSVVAEVMAQQEQDRTPSACVPVTP